MEETGRLIDCHDYPEINCTSLADCYKLGDRVRFVVWDWFRIDGIWQKRVTGIITRPIAGLIEDRERSWQMMSKARNPINESRSRAH